MARITVEDCLTKETNRFALVLLAAKRTKQILQGSKVLTNQATDNKQVVTALREIAEGRVRFMTADEAAIAREQGFVENVAPQQEHVNGQNGGQHSSRITAPPDAARIFGEEPTPSKRASKIVDEDDDEEELDLEGIDDDADDTDDEDSEEKESDDENSDQKDESDDAEDSDDAGKGGDDDDDSEEGGEKPASDESEV